MYNNIQRSTLPRFLCRADSLINKRLLGAR